MAKPRYRHRNRDEHPSAHIHDFDGHRVRVGGEQGYDAVLVVIDEAGRTLLSRLGFLRACATAGAFSMFVAAVDIPIRGYRDWWMISGIPVEISRHTCRVTYTRLEMNARGLNLRRHFEK